MNVFQHPADERHGFAGMASAVVTMRCELFMQAAQLDLRIEERADKLPHVARGGAAKGEYLIYKFPIGRIQSVSVFTRRKNSVSVSIRKFILILFWVVTLHVNSCAHA